ncbi:hypothetical protein EHF33_04560 [Deinococcus psychrotolerans]|uniref:Uncharacterized protein n=1 Tax=Deinococcus psychrotolerans TaxID=2489213 RepID=A0A3G8YAB9_9DEIO|nr:hypothetical protein [Deinococcus psychrotolerans]AZI42105.1 hypothetical protein EHF33_04560 [Deinococcus psychrotolerans]
MNHGVHPVHHSAEVGRIGQVSGHPFFATLCFLAALCRLHLSPIGQAQHLVRAAQPQPKYGATLARHTCQQHAAGRLSLGSPLSHLAQLNPFGTDVRPPRAGVFDFNST